ncbi:MAG TPA: citrate/2-methylcitrate synthase, partial [Candidatus Pelagibacter bacterium]|nr:citrate/2-methylcitrate synthase [Candidatus Pelagibacter bacterium]
MKNIIPRWSRIMGNDEKKNDVKKGLIGIVVDETTISKVMPDINSLTYRGYPVQDLCQNCRFEEVAYLVWHANLPNTLELKKFESEERQNRRISINLTKIIEHMPKKSHPMD